MTPDASSRSSIIRGTPHETGRIDWARPGVTALQVLHCGRIRTDARVPPIHVDPGQFETALVCLAGVGRVRVGTERFLIEPYDTVYVPRDTHFMVWSAAGTVDIAEVRAPVEERHPLQYVRYADQRAEMADQHPDADQRMCVLLGDRAAAGRFSVGVFACDSRDTASWAVVPDVPGTEVACCYARVPPAAGPMTIEWPAAQAASEPAVHEGDLVVGLHRCRADGPAMDGTVVVLWMLGAEREVVGDRFRLPVHTFSRSRVVP